MNKSVSKRELEKQVIQASREFGISSVLFRHKVGQELKVNVTDMECLGILYFKGDSTPGELSAYTGLTSGATTAMLDRLERGGLIKRLPNPNDRRGTIIAADKSSAKTVGPYFASVRAAQDKLLERFSEAELRAIKEYLEQSAEMWHHERHKLQQK